MSEKEQNAGLIVTALVAVVAITGIVMMVLGSGRSAELTVTQPVKKIAGTSSGEKSVAGQAFYGYYDYYAQREETPIAEPEFESALPTCILNIVSSCKNGLLVMKSINSDCEVTNWSSACPLGQTCPAGENSCVTCPAPPPPTCIVDELGGVTAETYTKDENCVTKVASSKWCPDGCDESGTDCKPKPEECTPSSSRWCETAGAGTPWAYGVLYENVTSCPGSVKSSNWKAYCGNGCNAEKNACKPCEYEGTGYICTKNTYTGAANVTKWTFTSGGLSGCTKKLESAVKLCEPTGTCTGSWPSMNCTIS